MPRISTAWAGSATALLSVAEPRHCVAKRRISPSEHCAVTALRREARHRHGQRFDQRSKGIDVRPIAPATLRTAHQRKAWQGICTSERCGGIDEDSAGKHGQSVGDEKRGDGLHRRCEEGQSLGRDKQSRASAQMGDAGHRAQLRKVTARRAWPRNGKASPRNGKAWT